MAYEAIKKAKLLVTRKENDESTKSLIVPKENDERQDKSKLMIYVEVLCILVSNGRPMLLTQLRQKIGRDEGGLKQNLRSLWKWGYIEEKELGDNNSSYVVTERGIKVLNVVSPLIKESLKIQMRDFELISNTLSGAGYP